MVVGITAWRDTSHSEHNTTVDKQIRKQQTEKRLATLLRHTDSLPPTTCVQHELVKEKHHLR